ncbi:unnamed protein product [Pieris macdunnoughi]|uniref:tRNA (32-2'-O)-methyltransferase regulator THADA n=1 Tax=Pieris macdunnoughi TaxID=345717 RepID=A0A821R412_9NEOP|nr:unnamed protein product [Pieris macdunnoughi]
MNGLSLRISGGGCKIKNPIGVEPMLIPEDYINNLYRNEHHNNFLKATSVDQQLSSLKDIFSSEPCNNENLRFLVVVFLQAEQKHPVKSFLTRCIAKNIDIQEAFSVVLSKEITWAASFKNLEVSLADYLRDCLNCAVSTLSSNTLSPTEKTELFNLAHLTLRLLLYIVQKVGDKDKIVCTFEEITRSVKHILFDEDAPMDTKSVCGMLLVAMYILENGDNSWIDLLSLSTDNSSLEELLSNEAAKLSLYSAIATVVPVQQLHLTCVGTEIAVIVLIDHILAIGERMSSDSTFTLGVTRSLVHISKSLDKSSMGVKVTDRLLVFVWAHLEHYMDSVRHLTSQMLSNIVKYSSGLERQGDKIGVTSIIKALRSFDRNRKSFYLTLTSLTNELGAQYVMEVFPNVINEVICVLNVQAVQASATTFLEVLLQKHMKESPGKEAYEGWVMCIVKHVSTHSLDSAVMNILEDILALAVKMDENILEYMLPYVTEATNNLKCVLMLLSVIRRSRRTSDVIGYELLEVAAVDTVDETRILSLSLVVESPKSTEMFSPEDLKFVLYFLKYNCNAQAPHFRQLMLSMMKKFVKRLEDSYKVLKRKREQSDHYLQFVEDLREQCYSGLLLGANYSRRLVALQVLDWIEHVSLEGYQRVWRDEHVDRLLSHLEDSYENNKILALRILTLCPKETFEKTFSTSLKLEDVLSQASSVKPTDCSCAAYKLLLLRNRCGSYVRGLAERDTDRPERESFTLVSRLLSRVEAEVEVCESSVLHAAKDAPMYGLVHCVRYLLETVDAGAISSDSEWTQLITRMISLCLRVNHAVACVVNNSSPEGHLPMDMNGFAIEEKDSSNVCLKDGRPVTAQMVLLCAWRSVKEVSLLLGVISSKLSIEGECGSGGSVSAQSVCEMGEHFTALLAETKHRGAFEQAYVGFTKLLTRLWRCQSPKLHELPKRWLRELLAVIESGDHHKLCATRRSAGLPFMIQALVITELQVTGNPKCFSQCMRTLLHVGRRSPSVEARTHCTNVLRALYRNTNLNDAVAAYVGEGLLLALEGFEGITWQERNSSTLLFSALMVRIFGVTRGKDPDNLCTRNRMTGRIFFLRYPALADYMGNKLAEANDSDKLLRPSVYPVLLLLARLYPSALEGTVSNIKLVSFIPLVLSCAGSPVLKTRQLAARAMVPLISPHMYILHVEAMLKLMKDRLIKKNYCHGVILQLIKLFEAQPDDLCFDDKLNDLEEVLLNTKWIVEQTLTRMPCYLLTDDYVKMVDLIIQRFPEEIYAKLINDIKPLLNDILFNGSKSIINSGKFVCLANVVKLHFSILNIHNDLEETSVFIQKCLKHDTYEIVLVALNSLATQNKIQIISNSMRLLRKGNYIQLLCNVLDSKYLECTQKALQLLVLEENTQQDIINAKLKKKHVNDTVLLESLIFLLDSEHENLTHIYLKSLTGFLSKKIIGSSLSGKSVLEAIRVVFACAFSHNADNTREVVVEFLEEAFERLLAMDIDLDESELFEYKATLFCTIAILLEDDEQTYRQRIACIITNLYNRNHSHDSHVIPSRAIEFLMQIVGSCKNGKEILCVLSLLDFKSEVCMNDEVNDECRVFDTNERYNIFSEETVFTSTCARALQKWEKSDLLRYVHYSINRYRQTFESLCGQNLSEFHKNNTTNAKVALLYHISNTRTEM